MSDITFATAAAGGGGGVSLQRLVFAVLVCSGIACHALLVRRSLSVNGAFAAFVVGVVLICSGGHFAMPLFSFFYSCSRITRVRSDEKKRLDAEFKSEGGSRDAWQVLSNSFPALVASVAYAVLCGPNFQRLTTTTTLSSMLIAFVFGFFACCAGDTWASELGILQKTLPRLITSGRSVPKGTNGGVSMLGLAASALGGLFQGVVSFLYAMYTEESGSNYHYELILLGLFAGFVGSLIDSLLGANVQYSGFSQSQRKVVNHPEPDAKHICGYNWLSNNQVNIVAATTTGCLCSLVAASIRALFK